jgi:serine protease Do
MVARDPNLALLDSKNSPPASATFRTSVRVGESVYAFGFPLAGFLSTSGNFTVGNVTASSGIGDDTRMLQISAPVQPGNSGGPLLDQSGNLVGVVVAKLNALKVAAATEDLAQNVNFAIKSGVALSFLEANSLGPIPSTNAQPLQPADIAERAKSFSVYIECMR